MPTTANTYFFRGSSSSREKSVVPKDGTDDVKGSEGLAEEKLLIPKGSLAGEEKGFVTPGTFAAVILLGSLGGRVGGGKMRVGVAWGVLTALGGLIIGVPID